jgi:hypothetical protein
MLLAAKITVVLHAALEEFIPAVVEAHAMLAQVCHLFLAQGAEIPEDFDRTEMLLDFNGHPLDSIGVGNIGGMKMAWPPRFPHSRLAASSASGLRANKPSFAPRLANACAIERPRPAEHPVTTTTGQAFIVSTLSAMQSLLFTQSRFMPRRMYGLFFCEACDESLFSASKPEESEDV